MGLIAKKIWVSSLAKSEELCYVRYDTLCQGNNYQENVMLLRLYTMCDYYIKNNELLLQQSFTVQLFNSWFSRDVRKTETKILCFQVKVIFKHTSAGLSSTR